MVGAGRLGFTPGPWTDDTALTLALAQDVALALALAHAAKFRPFDSGDLIQQFVARRREGANSCIGHLLRHRHQHLAGAEPL